jgi:hypothetical protein
MIRRASKEARTDPQTGEMFDSAAELRCWHELKLRERAGEIYDLHRQSSFWLYACGPSLSVRPQVIFIYSDRYPNGRACKITLDFDWIENGERVYADYKGFQTDIARLRIAIFEACYGVRVRILGPAAMRQPRKAALDNVGRIARSAAEYGIAATKKRARK